MLKPYARIRKKFLAEEELELIRKLNHESKDDYDEDIIDEDLNLMDDKKGED